MRLTRSLLLLLLAAVATMPGLWAQGASRPRSPSAATDLFQMSHVWPVQLTFTRADWDAMRPAATPAQLGAAVTGIDGFVGQEGKRNGLSALRGLDFKYVHANIQVDDQRLDNIAVRYKGNGTYRAGSSEDKYSFKIDLNKYIQGQKLSGVTSFNLHSNITDASFMNEVLAFRLYRDAGAPAPRTAYARVTVTVPGLLDHAYQGLYSIVEDVDERFAEAHYKILGGAIFKPVTLSVFADLGGDWAAYNQRYDPKTALTANDKARIIEFSRLVSHADDATFTARLADFVDLHALAKHMSVLAWLANPDSLLQQGQNYYVYLHPTTHQLAFIPWDQDHSFGQFAWRPEQQQQQLDIMRPWMSPNRFLERVFSIAAFRTLYLSELSTLTKTLTLPERLSKQVDDLAAVLSPVVATEPAKARFALFNTAVAGERVARPFYGGTVPPIKPFVAIRQQAVLSQLRALDAR